MEETRLSFNRRPWIVGSAVLAALAVVAAMLHFGQAGLPRDGAVPHGAPVLAAHDSGEARGPFGFAANFALAGGLVAIGLYHLARLFFVPREKPILYAALGCGIGAVHLFAAERAAFLGLNGSLAFGLPPEAAAAAIDGLTYCGIVLMLALYERALYPHDISRWAPAAAAIVTALAALAVPAARVLPPEAIVQAARMAPLMTIPVGIYLIAGAFLALRREREGAGLQCFCLACFVVVILCDAGLRLAGSDGIRELLISSASGPGLAVPAGMFALVLAQTVFLARRFPAALRSRAADRAEQQGGHRAEAKRTNYALLNGVVYVPQTEEGVNGTAATEQAEAAAASAAAPFPADGLSPQRRFTILLADGDETHLAAVAGVLAGEPYRVLKAQDGEEALRLLSREPQIDLVLMSAGMPKMSGMEALRRVRERFGRLELPVLLMADRHEPEEMRQWFAAGANDCLVKPFHAPELAARVRALLETKEAAEKAAGADAGEAGAWVHPHFLNNALHLIGGVCARNPEQAAQLLAELQRYLQLHFELQKQNGYVPLTRELELVRSYVALEKARFGGLLKVIISADDYVPGHVPPLTVQPLVENAVRHGALRRAGGGIVSVTVTELEDGVAIEVRDNGEGIPRGRLEELLQELGTAGAGSSAGIAPRAGGRGLRHIHRRLMRLYGTGLTLESAEGTGTKVSLFIPKMEI